MYFGGNLVKITLKKIVLKLYQSVENLGLKIVEDYLKVSKKILTIAE